MASTHRTRPRILMLIDVHGWAFHTLSRGLQEQLCEAFDIDIVTLIDKPKLHLTSYDILHVFGVKEQYHQQFRMGQCKTIKGLYNTHWLDLKEPIEQFHNAYTNEVDALTVPILSMYREMKGLPIPVFLAPEGVDTQLFSLHTIQSGPLIAGWAGNTSKAYKRFHMAQQACNGICELRVADGTLSQEQMIRFYQSVDVILCTSQRGEGCPRSMLEGMSCGCFPISFPVGVAPEVIITKENGFLVKEESADEIRMALQWCKNNIDTIRNVRSMNHEYIRATRDWSCIAPCMARIYHTVLDS